MAIPDIKGLNSKERVSGSAGPSWLMEATPTLTPCLHHLPFLPAPSLLFPSLPFFLSFLPLSLLALSSFFLGW